MKKETILINLIGGPGIGKTTLSAFLFVQMKLKKMNVEYVQEVAKPLVYLKKFDELNAQLEVTKEQFEKFEAYNGTLDFIITDGSILHGLYFNRNNPYNTSDVEEVEQFILEKHASMPTINILLTRPEDAYYEKEGRLQDEEESNNIDTYLEAELVKFGIDYIKIEADLLNMIGIINHIKREEKKLKLSR